MTGAVFGGVKHPGFNCVFRRIEQPGNAFHVQRSGSRATQTEQHLGNFTFARAQQPGERHHLTFVQVQIKLSGVRRDLRCAQTQHLAAPRTRLKRPGVRRFTEHGVHRFGELIGSKFTGQPAVTQHHGAIRQTLQIGQAMGDINNRHPALAQGIDQGK